MNDIQTVTLYYKIVYGIVALALAAYSLYLAREARRALARLDSAAKR
jgi:hypothetical protein